MIENTDSEKIIKQLDNIIDLLLRIEENTRPVKITTKSKGPFDWPIQLWHQGGV